MKKLLSIAALLGLAGILYLGAPPAHATIPYSQLPRLGIYNEAGLNVAAGAVINSAVLDLSKVSECTVIAENSAGGSDRALTVNWIASDATTILFQTSVTVTAATRKLVVINSATTPASAPTGFTVLPTTTGKKMSFSLAAAGSAVGSLVIYCD